MSKPPDRRCSWCNGPLDPEDFKLCSDQCRESRRKEAERWQKPYQQGRAVIRVCGRERGQTLN